MSLANHIPLFEAVNADAYPSTVDLDELKGEELFGVLAELDLSGGVRILPNPTSKHAENSLAFRLDCFLDRLGNYNRNVVCSFDIDPVGLSMSALVRLKTEDIA